MNLCLAKDHLAGILLFKIVTNEETPLAGASQLVYSAVAAGVVAAANVPATKRPHRTQKGPLPSRPTSNRNATQREHVV